ncbi:MAG TPA: hypothetical protein VH853_06455 [Polyangia bacterium]|nr:hypothetical protein [Polyangia bacterium]
MAANDPDMFEFYVKSLKGLGMHTFRVGGETIKGSIVRAAVDFIEVNAIKRDDDSQREVIRIPFRAIQYVIPAPGA